VNLNQVTLPTPDVAASVQFYERMGFTPIVRSPQYARFECPQGEATFSVHLTAHLQQDSGVVVYFECTDLDGKVNSLEALGFSFTQLPTDEPWLWREARLRDPSGNVVCLFSAGENRKNPPWRIPRPAA
jgi:catechol 2,3-dioxygenase-like lactoylglutathione lyase family enzyme